MFKSKKIIAVIGCGYWGKNLARNFFELGALGAIVDPNLETAQLHAKQYDVPALDMNEALADSDIKAVVIAAPAELHKKLALQAITAGKDIYVEKPLALSTSDGEEIRLAAESAGVTLMVGHLLQYHPVFVKLRNLVKNGDLGNLRYAYSHRLSMGKFRVEEDAFWSLAPHDVSMILSLFNESPLEVRGGGLDFITPGVADEARVDLIFPSGGRAHIFVSWLHPFKEQKLVVVGDKAMAVFDDTAPWEQKLAIYKHKINIINSLPNPIKSEVEYIEVQQGEPLKSECQHFLDCIISKSKPITDASEAIGVLKVLEAVKLPKA
jgi:UDP-2-acetamido-3-amino-2,3-dideoxy-glucuronate N-acetyltransferase